MRSRRDRCTRKSPPNSNSVTGPNPHCIIFWADFSQVILTIALTSTTTMEMLDNAFVPLALQELPGTQLSLPTEVILVASSSTSVPSAQSEPLVPSREPIYLPLNYHMFF